MSAAVIDHVRCEIETCRVVFPRSRWMVRRDTRRCRSCQQRLANRNSDYYRAIAAKSQAVQREKRAAAIAPRLEQLSKVECYRLGRTDECNRLRAKAKRDEARA